MSEQDWNDFLEYMEERECSTDDNLNQKTEWEHPYVMGSDEISVAV